MKALAGSLLAMMGSSFMPATGRASAAGVTTTTAGTATVIAIFATVVNPRS